MGREVALANSAGLDGLQREVSLRPFVTLRAGGPAERFSITESADRLGQLAILAQEFGATMTILGGGSNVLPSDAGVSGLVVLNRARKIEVDGKTGVVLAESGAAIQDVFLKTAQAGLEGFECVVGVPGTLGGALVSNAGAYRANVSTYLTRLEIAFEGRRQWVDPSWMQFSYRDSRLRRPDAPSCALLQAEFCLPVGHPKAIYDLARENQRQRISKQPPQASAGSFFKNVNDKALAESLATLPDGLKQAGVVPAGYLIEAAGLKGKRVGRAAFSHRHANFIVNLGASLAQEIRDLAELAKAEVLQQFGVHLEEEVLYLGDWSKYQPPVG